ncbi:MAG: cell division protein SepF [Clostridia bacterium]
MSFIKGIMNWVNGSDEEEVEGAYPEIGEIIDAKKEKAEETTIASVRDHKRAKVVDINKNSGGQLDVVVVKPQKFENAIDVADNLKLGKTIVLNFEQTDAETTRRLLDFLTGATYALNAELTKVSMNACIITPTNVNVLSELVDELEITGIF